MTTTPASPAAPQQGRAKGEKRLRARLSDERLLVSAGAGAVTNGGRVDRSGGARGAGW